jgi:hypothetical protein
VTLHNAVSLDTQGGPALTIGAPGNLTLTGGGFGALISLVGSHTSEIDTAAGAALTIAGTIGVNGAGTSTLKIGGQNDSNDSFVELTGEIANNVAVVAIPHGTIAYGPSSLTIKGILESNGGSLILKGTNPKAALFTTPPGVQLSGLQMVPAATIAKLLSMN